MNFIKRATFLLKNILTALIIYPFIVLATIPLSVLFVKKAIQSWILSAVLGTFLGTLLLPVAIIAGIPLSSMAGVWNYRRKVREQEILISNDALINQLNKFSHQKNFASLSSDNIEYLELLAKDLPNVNDQTEIKRLLKLVSGEGAHTPIELNDYYSLINPITLKKTIKKSNGEALVHEQLYETSELIQYIKNCKSKKKFPFNPLIRDHIFKDKNKRGEYLCKGKDNILHTYEFLPGFTQVVLDALLRLHEILDKHPKNLSTKVITQTLKDQNNVIPQATSTNQKKNEEKSLPAIIEKSLLKIPTESVTPENNRYFAKHVRR